MSRFYVGQRVQVKCATTRNDGAVTTITRLNVAANDYGRRFIGYEVDIVCTSSPLYPLCVFEAHELIPLDDDSRRLVTWDEVKVWKPAGVRAS